MKGRDHFTKAEISRLRELVGQKERSNRDEQKRLRGRMRALDFYITDFSYSPDGFTVRDIDRLIEAGVLSVVDEPASGSQRIATTRTPQRNAPSTKQRLPDYLAPDLRVVFCGTAAGRKSAARGHYYAGPGNDFWQVLWESGITAERLSPETDFRVLEFGVGLTDLAKRAAGTDVEVAREAYGVEEFLGKMRRYQPRWVAFHGKNAAKEYLRAVGRGRDVPFGRQCWTVAGIPAYVAPSASGSARRPEYEGKPDRVSWYRDLAALLEE